MLSFLRTLLQPFCSASLLFVGCSLLVACGAPPPEPKEPWQAVRGVPPERPLCGWEEVTEASAPVAIGEGLALNPGTSIAVVAPTPETLFGAVQEALAPARDSLVRVKLVVKSRWLVSTTYPSRKRQPPKPPPAERAVRIVGHRQITRSTQRQADRFADLRVDGTQVHLFVENEAQNGLELAVGALAEQLRALEPPAMVLAVTATPATPWQSVLEVVVAAACFDRQPGDEPHEVILD